MTLICGYVNKESKKAYIAGDREITIGQCKTKKGIPKIFKGRIDDHPVLIGGAGTAGIIYKIKSYIEENNVSLPMIAEKLRKEVKRRSWLKRIFGDIFDATLLIITNEGKIYRICFEGSIEAYDEVYWAIGSGQTVGKALMHNSHYIHKKTPNFYHIFTTADYMLNGVNAQHDILILDLV